MRVRGAIAIVVLVAALSDTRHGFAFPSFTDRSTLSFTKDGGRDWTQVPIPKPPPRPGGR